MASEPAGLRQGAQSTMEELKQRLTNLAGHLAGIMVRL